MMPLGVLSIATRVRQRLPNTTIEVLDGTHIAHEQVLERVSDSIVGVSVNAANLAYAETVVRAAKARGALVVLGGSLATTFSDYLEHVLPEAGIVVRMMVRTQLFQLSAERCRQRQSGVLISTR